MTNTLDTMVDRIPDILYRLDEDGNFVFLSDSVRALGYDPGDLAGRHFGDIIHPGDLASVRRSEVLKTGKAPSCCKGLFDERRTGGRITRDLSVRIRRFGENGEGGVECRITALGCYSGDARGGAGKYAGTVGIMSLVDEGHEALEAIGSFYESAYQCMRLMEGAGDDSGRKIFLREYLDSIRGSGVVKTLLAVDGTILYSSPSVAMILGYRPWDFAGTNIREHALPEELETILGHYRRSVPGGPCFSFNLRLRAADGSWRNVRSDAMIIAGSDGCALCVAVYSRDFTPGDEFEIPAGHEDSTIFKNAHDVQTLESLEILAGGIAHDIGNLVTTIKGSIALVQTRLPEDDQNRRFLAHADSAATMTGRLVSQLLSYATKGTVVSPCASPGEVIRDSASFALCGARIDCRFEISGDLFVSAIDSTCLSRVIHNIVLNARQAMPGGGSITISARNEELGPGNRYALTGGPYIAVTIADTGRGIPAEELPRIYEMGYTTRPTGNGLGLAVSRSLMEQSGGRIFAESREGDGSTFTLYIPGAGKDSGNPSRWDAAQSNIPEMESWA